MVSYGMHKPKRGNYRDFNRVAMHLLSKFGGSSLNRWEAIARSSSWLTGIRAHKHTHTRRQRQYPKDKTGLGYKKKGWDYFGAVIITSLMRTAYQGLHLIYICNDSETTNNWLQIHERQLFYCLQWRRGIWYILMMVIDPITISTQTCDNHKISQMLSLIWANRLTFEVSIYIYIYIWGSPSNDKLTNAARCFLVISNKTNLPQACALCPLFSSKVHPTQVRHVAVKRKC